MIRIAVGSIFKHDRFRIVGSHLIYLHYTKFYGMEMMKRKWPAIKNWTNQDVLDRENLEMLKGKIGLVELIEDDDKEDENEKDAEKRKLRELIYKIIKEKFERVLKEKREPEDLLKEYMDMDELFSRDEKLQLFVKRFQEEFTIGLRKDEDRAGTSAIGYKDGVNVEADNTDVNVTDNTTAIEEDEMERAAKKSAKEAAKKTAKEAKEKAEKRLKKKKKKHAERKQIEKKQAEMQKAAAKKSKEDEMQAVADAKLKNKMQKDAEAKKQSQAKKKEKITAEATCEKVVEFLRKDRADERIEEALLSTDGQVMFSF
ncbi:hypothetical protein Tco_0431655 [Tanacetum coccineum]